MSTNPILQQLQSGQCVGCHWLALGSPTAAEIMAQGRPDAMIFDLQHGLWTRQSLELGIGLVRHLTTVLCRVAENSPYAIGSALDAGARGVIVPFVETAAEAEAAVVAAKYPPRGQRSFGNVRPVFDALKYVTEANGDIFVAVMIETAKGLANATAIAAVPGVDMVFIGPFDLSLSLGVYPELGPKHQQALEVIKDATLAQGKFIGIFTPHGAAAADRRAQGFQMVILANDQDLLQSPAKAQIERFRPGSGRGLVKGAVALVTGSNRGVGRETVQALLREGAGKIYCAARDLGSLTSLLAEAPDRLVPVQLDITKPADVAAAARACPDVTLLVNNAGENSLSPLLGAESDAAARREIEVNYFGTLAMCRAFAPVLRDNGGGGIVNLIAGHAQASLPLMGSFCAAKAALLSLTQALRAELAGQKTHVLGVLPGLVENDQTRALALPKITPAYVARALVQGLRLRLEEVYPGDMAGGIAYGAVSDPKAAERRFAAHLSQTAS
jgi:2-keto-3-deoxy-L-rhamnonate aldolase RhmA/NAD(P)-dependent dehydrogenase (short-subunit alcohol dehydrogenase family)